MRLDSELVRRGLACSRERAKEYISSGQVFVGGVRTLKPAFAVSESDSIELRGETLKYVGRGGLKLEGAVKVFDIAFSGLTCLDIGASTGGFTDCMLQNGAKKVYAVDVGHNQLAEKLKNDPRVANIEGVNVKDVAAEMFPEPIDFAVSDLSFISARYAADALAKTLPENGRGVILIKPQFEAGRRFISKGGIVRDPAAHIAVLEGVCGYFESLGFTVSGLVPSPIKGGDGNAEYLLYFVKQKPFTAFSADFKKITAEALGRNA